MTSSDTDGSFSNSTANDEETRFLETVVIALVPEIRLVVVTDAEGRHYAITRRTQGVDCTSLQEGKKILCEVSARTGVVVSAKARQY